MFWEATSSIHTWWSAMPLCHRVPRRGVRSLIILTTWKIWRERNASILRRQHQ
ncbi:hypothetical protein GQ55_8G201400 [Panicum hallii var. hallii]|uniref:Uncharacterized protein n=1 Tax=Panicum hallii var. hallii TaxID=1504633 RepID=A0A2T7CPA3_9POAL|nr:hypothetical protein GQ55_8G201400 [Panicum hallii var. hallii]